MDYLDNKTVAPKWLSKEDFIFSIYTACKYEIECSEGAVGKLFYDGCRNINLTTTALKNVEWRTINFWHQVLKDISVGGALVESNQCPSPTLMLSLYHITCYFPHGTRHYMKWWCLHFYSVVMHLSPLTKECKFPYPSWSFLYHHNQGRTWHLVENQ